MVPLSVGCSGAVAVLIDASVSGSHCLYFFEWIDIACDVPHEGETSGVQLIRSNRPVDFCN